jgi:hypothetical protein
MKKFKKILNNISGLTMVELIIALAISLVIVAAAGYIFLSQSGAMRASKSVSTEQQRLNNAFSAVEYNLKMAGFDYGDNYFKTTGLLPVQIFSPNYSTSPYTPYEVLISYSTLVNYANGCDELIKNADGANYSLGPNANCSTNNFYKGEVINIVDPGSNSHGIPLKSPYSLCVTQTPAGKFIQANPGNNGIDDSCPFFNNIPPNAPSGGYISIIQQILFYWGNQNYGNQTSGFNPPFNQVGTLYECVAATPLTNSQPSCAANTTIQLDSNVNNFSVMPLAGYINAVTLQPYVYLLTISAESGAAVTPSPAYSVNTGYNPNITGGNPQQNRSTIPGYNIVKTLNANILLRNVEYGS